MPTVTPFLPTFATVQIQDANHAVQRLLFSPLDVPHQPQRRAQHVTDAKSHCADVGIGQIPIEQVLDDLLLTGREHHLRDLAAGLERPSAESHLAAGSHQLQFELLLGIGQHDEAALGARHLDRRVEHQGQHFFEHLARPQRTQPLEQRRHVPQFGGGRRRHVLARHP